MQSFLSSARRAQCNCDVAPAVLSRLNWSLAPEGGPDDEAEAVYRRADHQGFAGAGARCEDSRPVPQAWDEATFYNWKSKFGGLDVSEARRLKQLEGENARLKKLLADSMLDNAALKDLLSKKW